MKNKTILLTGGTGYIGSHACVHLLNSGYNVIIIDSLINSSIIVVDRIKKITGRSVQFYQGDIRNKELLLRIFSENKIDAVMHFAGLKSVSESLIHSLDYYDVNISGTLNICRVMAEYQVYNFVFSSSAIVYGASENVPFSEDQPTLEPINPYGKSKWIAEKILEDLVNTNSNWSMAILRYFNPIGAHSSGLIGEDPNDIPNNLLPYISQVAIGKLKKLSIFGNDYPTKDGTGIRDYIHVEDLVRGHLLALDYILDERNSGYNIWNLGTGRGYSVLEIIEAFEKSSQRSIPYEIKSRREGDIAICYANSDKASYQLGWIPKYSLSTMMDDTWNWQIKNPDGYN